MAPDIPTFREQGHDVLVGAWRCIVGPKGHPEDRLRFLETNVLAALKDPEFQDRRSRPASWLRPAMPRRPTSA